MLTPIVSIDPPAERRIGRFKISRELLMHNWREAQIVFAQVVVVRCEMRFATDSLDYEAFSPHFDVLELGAVPPEYLPLISSESIRDADGNHLASFTTILRWEKVKPLDPNEPLFP